MVNISTLVGGYANVPASEKTELARFLEVQVKRSTYREMEALTGIPRSMIGKIVHGYHKGYPDLETLTKVATAYNLPVWRVMEMAGIDVGMAETPTALGKRLASLATAYPEVMKDITERLTEVDPGDLRGILAYIETILRHRDDSA